MHSLPRLASMRRTRGQPAIVLLVTCILASAAKVFAQVGVACMRTDGHTKSIGQTLSRTCRRDFRR